MLVKVSNGKESFWISDVKKIKDSTSYKGKIDNELLDSEMKLGDILNFERKDIIDVWLDDFNKSARDLLWEKINQIEED